jgi:hypothetical protein
VMQQSNLHYKKTPPTATHLSVSKCSYRRC